MAAGVGGGKRQRTACVCVHDCTWAAIISDYSLTLLCKEAGWFDFRGDKTAASKEKQQRCIQEFQT